MTDPHHAIIEDYVTPTPAELAARTKRNRAIALALVGFVAFIFMLMLFKLGLFN